MLEGFQRFEELWSLLREAWQRLAQSQDDASLRVLYWDPLFPETPICVRCLGVLEGFQRFEELWSLLREAWQRLAQSQDDASLRVSNWAGVPFFSPFFLKKPL